MAYQPPAQQAPPQSTNNTTVVVAQQPTTSTVVNTTFGDSPMSYNCHVCKTQQVTRVTHKVGTMTILIVIILCVLGLWPCALIPLCVPALQDSVHTCPNCNTEVGVHKKM
ncbi:lipopolysaccharide-induced tumor necrosis factor-alpha factor homolog [Dysidea avara]|uniref:lipopolysaccharide-induced tumor necrosis factor-alpha factor homolog n=1 Tax=Dysidea avara TaxID=196820 RepID=UPI00331C3834